MIRTVIFDFGGTLIQQVSDEQKSLDTLSINLLPGARRCLSRMASRYQIAVLSNTETTKSSELASCLTKLGLGNLAIRSFTSVSLGVKKPHPKAFLGVMEALAIDARETVMIGNDLIEDIAGANGVGIWTVYVTNADVSEAIRPDLIVDRLTCITPRLIESLAASSKRLISGSSFSVDEEPNEASTDDPAELMLLATALEQQQDFRRIGLTWYRCAARLLDQPQGTTLEYKDDEATEHHFPTFSATKWNELSKLEQAARAFRYAGYHFEADGDRQSAYLHYLESAEVFVEDKQFDEASRSYFLALTSFARRFGRIERSMLEALESATRVCVAEEEAPYLQRMVIYYRRLGAIVKSFGNHAAFSEIRGKRLDSERKLLLAWPSLHRYILWSIWKYVTGFGHGLLRWFGTLALFTLGIFPALYFYLPCFRPPISFLSAVVYSSGRLVGFQTHQIQLSGIGQIVNIIQGGVSLLLVAALVAIIVARTSE